MATEPERRRRGRERGMRKKRSTDEGEKKKRTARRREDEMRILVEELHGRNHLDGDFGGGIV